MTEAIEGLFRSEHFLVIDREKARFPDRCIWSNDPVDGDPSELTVAHMPEELIGRGAFRALIAFSQRSSAKIDVPICDACKKKSGKRGFLGAIIGVACWLIAGGLMAWISNSGLPPDDRGLIGAAITALVLFTLGLIAILVGYALQQAMKGSHASFLDERWIWLTDVHPQFLDSLPEWDGPKFSEL